MLLHVPASLRIETQPHFKQKLFYVKLTTFFFVRTIENQAKLILDSEITFKIKVRSPHLEQFCELRLRQQLFAFKEFCMEMRLSNIFKTTNISKLIKAILENSHRVLQDPVYFLRAVEFCATFDIQIAINFSIFWEKLQSCTFQKAHRSLSKHANIHINRAPITKKRPFEKIKNLSFFGGCFSITKIAGILNF